MSDEDEVSAAPVQLDLLPAPIGVLLAEARERAMASYADRIEEAVRVVADEMRRAASWGKWDSTAEVYSAIMRANIQALMQMYGEVRMCRLCGEPIVFFRSRGHITMVLGAETCRLHSDECSGQDE